MLNDVYQLSVQGVLNGTNHIHTLHFLEQGFAGPVTGADLITAWSGAPMTAYRGCFSIDMSPCLQLTAQKVCGSVPLPAADVVVPAPANRIGNRTMGAVQWQPAFLAALVNLKGTLAGRRYSGRFFLGGLYESDTEFNDMSAAYLTLIQAYASALTAAFITPAGPIWRLFAFSRLLADGDPLHTRRNPDGSNNRISDPVTAVQCQLAGSPVKSIVVSTRPTTMRSRKYGHGT